MPALTASSDVDIVNLALGRIGVGTRISSLQDNTAEAKAAVGIPLSLARLQCLEEGDWPFARRRIFPVAVTASSWSALTTYPAQVMATYPAINGLVYASLQPANLGNEPDLSQAWWQLVSRDDWAYVYQYPADMVAARQLVTGARAVLPEQEFAYVEENDPVLGRLLVTDTAGAELAYTALVADVTQYPPSFVDAMAWRLAQELVGPLRREPRLVEAAAKAYEMAIGRAFARVQATQRPDLPPTSKYIQGR